MKDKSNKHLYQLAQAKNGVKLLAETVETVSTYEEMINIINVFLKYMNEANEKNKVINKGIIALKKYYENESYKNKSVEAVVQKTKLKKAKAINKSIKKKPRDLFFEYKILRGRGLSYQQIADYSTAILKVKVSKSTIINLFKENEQ
jgi:hypothetical protein